jgi:hypothetical protein
MFGNGVAAKRRLQGKLFVIQGISTINDEERGLVITDEPYDLGIPPTQHVLDLTRSAVPKAQPNDLWGCAQEQASLMEIAVLRDDGKPVRPSVSPNALIVRRRQPGGSDVLRTGKNVRQERD